MIRKECVAVLIAILVLLSSTCFSGEVIFVDAAAEGANNGSSWQDAFAFLQDALIAAADDDEIKVAQGTYLPDRNVDYPTGTGDRHASFFLSDGIIIVGDLNGDCTVNSTDLALIAFHWLESGE